MKHIAIASCLLCLLLVFATGCTSTPPVTSPEVAATIAPERDLAQYGVPFSSDPFLSPFTLLMSTDEFVTLKIRIALPEAARVDISGDVEAPDGTKLARLYSRQDMHTYWVGRGRDGDPDMVKRNGYIDRFYAPDLDFSARAGRTEYYVVMIGKSPIPRPAKAILTVMLGSESQRFELDLPPIKK